jgi:hypothetical protein
LANDEKPLSREGFAFASLVFGIVALATWRWTQVGTVVAVMSVGFGVVAFKSKQRLVAGIGILMGAVGLILSFTTVFLRWP